MKVNDLVLLKHFGSGFDEFEKGWIETVETNGDIFVRSATHDYGYSFNTISGEYNGRLKVALCVSGRDTEAARAALALPSV